MISLELEEESKRSLAMEAEVEKYLRQLTKHREDANSKLLGEQPELCTEERHMLFSACCKISILANHCGALYQRFLAL